MHPPTQLRSIVVGGSSSADFWVADIAGTLYRYRNSGWKKYAPPSSKEYSRFSFLELTHNFFLCVALDNDLRAHFFTISDGTWRKDQLVHKFPVLGLAKASSRKAYATGDWGSFFEFDGRGWSKLSVPVEKHITSILITPDRNIWLAISGEGIFHFDGKVFSRIPTPAKERTASIQLVEGAGSTVFAVTSNQQFLKLQNRNFVPASIERDTLFNVVYSDEFGWDRMCSGLNDTTYLSFAWPKEFESISQRLFPDSAVVMTSLHAKIYVGHPQADNCFINMANTYDVAGNALNRSAGAAFFDLNEDKRPDLFVFSASSSSKLYLDQPHARYLDVTESAGLAHLEGRQIFSYTDLNGDGHVDLLFSKLGATGDFLAMYEFSSPLSFALRSTLSRVPPYGQEELGDVGTVDYYKSGSLDIELVNYLGPTVGVGNCQILRNRWYGSAYRIDSSMTEKTLGWNIQSVWADFDGDGDNDWLVLSKWQKKRLLMRRENQWVDETDIRFDHPLRLYATQVIAADYDNDGDLDLFVLSDSSALQLHENNGKGFFVERTDKIKLLGNSREVLSALSEKNMNVGDFNNDGYIDIFLTVKSKGGERNFIFENRAGKTFIDRSINYGISFPYVKGTVIADIDNDGDLDIFGYGNGPNVLWINNLDNTHYIKLNLSGSKSNSLGLSAKVWIYDSGFVDSASHLRGFTQIGNYHIGRNQFNDRVAHFGVDPSHVYDIKVQFYGGAERVVRNVGAGTVLDVAEFEGIASLIFATPGAIYRVTSSREIQLYALTVLCGLMILYVGTRGGARLFHWDVTFVFILVSVNLLFFGVLLFLGGNSSFAAKYLAPLAVLFVGTLLPLGIFSWVKRIYPATRSIEEIRDELFQILLNFSHGAWALNNLTSIMFLSKASEEQFRDERFISQFRERARTFTEMTLPALRRIISYAKMNRLDPSLIASAEQNAGTIVRHIGNLEYGSIDDRVSAMKVISSSVQQVRDVIDYIKRAIFSHYSSDPAETIGGVLESLDRVLKENNVVVRRKRMYDGETQVLIRSSELADVIDNCIHNSLRAMQEMQTKEISITLVRRAPKICVEIRDTGKGIPREQWERIFERGYSGSESTGHGLYAARTSLQKYGGRIDVKNNKTGCGTTFVIELNEVHV